MELKVLMRSFIFHIHAFTAETVTRTRVSRLNILHMRYAQAQSHPRWTGPKTSQNQASLPAGREWTSYSALIETVHRIDDGKKLLYT